MDPTTGTETTLHTYTYGDSNWLDKLTKFDNTTINYDAIGNPTNWKNGKTWTNLTWQNGRQLASMTSSSTTAAFTYDLAGIRDSKTVNGITYNYLTQNGQVVRQTWNDGTEDHVIDFIYDNQGKPYAFLYDGTLYYYILNLQGDVIIITDASGATVGRYFYDAWGNVIDGWGAMNDINPLRYRGYYYDKETGLYYLQSRYYDPVVKRFISADGQFDDDAGFVGYNLYSYCANSPVMYIDKAGESITAVLIGVGIGALVGAFAGWGYAKYFNVPKKDTWKYVVGGTVIGGMIGGCVGFALGAGSGAVLWSGPGMKEAAAEFAKANGLKVLETTLRGKLLSAMAKIVPYKYMRPLWEAASTQFLLSYAGKQSYVHVFLTAKAYSNMKSVFNSVEMQVIAELGMKIIWHFVQ